MSSSDLAPDNFSLAVFRELAVVEEPKPGTVARMILPLLIEAKPSKIPEPNTKVSENSSLILFYFLSMHWYIIEN